MTTVAVPRIGFLGAGKMATALARAWVSAGLSATDRIRACDPLPAARHAFAQDTGAACTEDARAVVAESELLVLAVKPQSMAALLREIQPLVTPRHLLVSIAAGISLVHLSDVLG